MLAFDPFDPGLRAARVGVRQYPAAARPRGDAAAGGRPGRVRRKGLREQSDQAGGPPGRGLLDGGLEGKHTSSVDGGEHTHQPALVPHPQPGGAHLSRAQAPVWLHQGALPGSG